MKVAFLSNFTVDLLAREFQVSTDAKVYISGFDQFRFEVLNPNSKYYSERPDFTVLFLDWETLISRTSVENLKSEILDLYSANCEYLNNYLIVNNVYLANHINSIHSYNLKGNTKETQLELNSFLANLAYENSNLFILDTLSSIEYHGISKLYDNASWLYARNRFSKFGLTEFSKKLRNLINAIIDKSCKCLILDLDNTLWGGILGEDGAFGVKLGQNFAGEEYQFFQKAIKKIKEKGVVLCICSKNNHSDVVDIFTRNPEMCLSLDDFVIKKINWERKDINIKNISDELGISEEHIVFLDDDPAERELVKLNTKVKVPDFPNKLEDLREFITRFDQEFFPKLHVTDEDVLKSDLYKMNLERNELRNTTVSFDDFIDQLDIRINLQQATESDLPRLAQLTQKTNQFNLNCRRYSKNDLKSILSSDSHLIYYGEVQDKFGKYGKVILAIIKLTGETAILESFLMSCRVIGRNVEGKFIKMLASKLTDIKKISAVFIESGKNSIVSEKLTEIGFTLESVSGNQFIFGCHTSKLLSKDDQTRNNR